MKKFILLSIIFASAISAAKKDDCLCYNTSSRNIENQGAGLYGEFLYWKAQESGLYYAHDCQSYFDGTDTKVASMIGDLHKVNPDWKPAFRVGAVFYLPYDKWETNLAYTYYRSKKSSTYNGVTPTLWGHSSRQIADFSNYAKASWRLNLNIADCEFGRQSYMGKYFSMKPYFGVRFAQVDQKLNINYVFNNNPANIGRLGASNVIKPKSFFAGAGLKAGIDTDFTLIKAIKFYTITSGSLLYGRFSNRYIVIQTLPAVPEQRTIANAGDSFYQSIASGQLAMGFKFGSYFNQNKNHFDFQIGWEQNIFFGVNKMQHYVHKLTEYSSHQDQVNGSKLMQENKNLTLQGIVVNATIDF
jgi:hypothetical protein